LKSIVGNEVAVYLLSELYDGLPVLSSTSESHSSVQHRHLLICTVALKLKGCFKINLDFSTGSLKLC